MSKYEGVFDAGFVSTRAYGCLNQEEFPKIFKSKALLAVETSKYMVPLTKAQKVNLDDKVLEMITGNTANGTFSRLVHTTDIVSRRRRDETQTDVVFFKKD